MTSERAPGPATSSEKPDHVDHLVQLPGTPVPEDPTVDVGVDVVVDVDLDGDVYVEVGDLALTSSAPGNWRFFPPIPPPC